MDIARRNLLTGMMLTPALATSGVLAGTIPVRASTSISGVQTPGFYRFSVGEFEVTALLDGYSAIPSSFVHGFDAGLAAEASRNAYKPFDPNQISLPVNGYVVNTGRNLVLIDAGAPSAAMQGLGKLSTNLLAAGFNPDDIDSLLFTHLHLDHVGALTYDGGAKAFKNATFICSETEWTFAHDEAVYSATPESFRPFIDGARMKVAPYLEHRQLFTGEKEVLPGITAIPLPGHTPGHTGFALSSGGESLLIWGDVVHFSGFQFAHPDWGVVFDADAVQAGKTRASMLDRAAADRMAVAGMHIDFPGVGYVERLGDAYRYITAPWDAVS